LNLLTNCKVTSIARFLGIKTVICTGDRVNELVPRLVEALVGVNVVGIAAGCFYTVVWTDEGKAYSFGDGKVEVWDQSIESCS